MPLKGNCSHRLIGRTAASSDSSLIPPAGWRNCKITRDRFLDSGKETFVSESRENPEAPHLVLHRILHLGEAELDSRGAKRVVELDDGVGCRDVDAGDWLRRDNQPPDRRR